MRHKKLIIGTGICLLGIALSAAWFIPCKLEATYAGKTPYANCQWKVKNFSMKGIIQNLIFLMKSRIVATKRKNCL